MSTGNNSNRLVKKIGTSHVVWFEGSNRWVQFEEPAYFIYKLWSEKTSIPEIVALCRKKYKLHATECQNFVKEIIAGLDEHANATAGSDCPEEITFPGGPPSKPFTTRTYLVHGYKIEISFENPLLGYYIHPLFAHLETGKSRKPDATFRIFDQEGRFVFYDGRKDKYLVYESINGLKRNLFTGITSTIYGKTENYWLADIHASAVSDGKNTILFSSSSGSGKSTLAALMVGNGFQRVADDFVLLAQRKAYPFPSAITIKKGAFYLFPENSLKEWNYGELKNRQVKLIYPDMKESSYVPKPVKTIVFVKYNPYKPFKFEKLPVLKALPLFYSQAFVSSESENAKNFIDWFTRLECYSLEYSDNEKTIEWISKLFKING